MAAAVTTVRYTVVRLPTTSEQLDAWYREHSSEPRSSGEPRTAIVAPRIARAASLRSDFVNHDGDNR